MTNQSNIIFAYLITAFVIFITMRGELRTYLGFFFGGGTPKTAPGLPNNVQSKPPSATSQSSALPSAASVAELGLFALG